jgi:hypothetical protein
MNNEAKQLKLNYTNSSIKLEETKLQEMIIENKQLNEKINEMNS